MTNRRTVALALVAMAFALVGCGSDSGDDGPKDREAAISGTALSEEAPNWVESSRETAQELSQDEDQRGLPVEETRCVPQSEGGDSPWTHECEIEYIYGPATSCEVAMTESGEIGATHCSGSGRNGDWYRECKESGAGAECDRLARRQLAACPSEVQGRQYCRDAVFGKQD